MPYLHIKITSDESAGLMALFHDQGITGLVEQSGGFDAYLALEEHTIEKWTSYLSDLERSHKFSFELATQDDKNWNQLWESNYDKVEIDDFCAVLAPFHQKLETTFEHVITITPRMAFGTGHHETTSSMIRHMRAMNFTNKTVLDMGCGTGILAILAEKLGGKNIMAMDYDENAIRSTIDAIEANGCKEIEAIKGDEKTSKLPEFDVVLANINRNFLIDNVNFIVSCTSTQEDILLSGFNTDDEKLVLETYLNTGCIFIRRMELNSWVSLLLKKNIL